VQPAFPDEAGDAQAEAVAAVLHVLGRLFDGEHDGGDAVLREVRRDLQAHHRLAGAAPAGDQRGAAFGDAADGEDVEPGNAGFQFLQRAHDLCYLMWRPPSTRMVSPVTKSVSI